MQTQPISFNGWCKVGLPKITSQTDNLAGHYVMTHLGAKTGGFRVPNEPVRFQKTDNAMLINIRDGWENAYIQKATAIIEECNKILKNDAVSRMYVKEADPNDIFAAQSVNWGM